MVHGKWVLDMFLHGDVRFEFSWLAQVYIAVNKYNLFGVENSQSRSTVFRNCVLGVVQVFFGCVPHQLGQLPNYGIVKFV